MLKDLIKLSVFLAVCCSVAAAALSLTYVSTYDKIEFQKSAKIQEALSSECLPGCSTIKEINGYYIGYEKSGKRIGYAFRVSPKGYGGAIDMIVGIKADGRVAGIKILSMKETPGLGSQADTPQFLGKFIGKNSSSRFKAKKDFDAISGATITSQAVADGIKEALQKFQKIK